MTAHSPRAGLGAVTAAGRDGPAATPCCVAPGRATPSAGLLPTTVPPYVGRSAQLRVLDLFSGIGGFSLGLDRTGGFKTVPFCEIDPFCRRVLAKHWPDVPCHEDVRSLSRGDVAERVDVICGGFPCQDISAAGRRKGLAGARSGLWAEYARIAGEFRPRYIVMENSAELLGNGLGDILGDMAALGYDACWDCVPAAVLGAPHGRDRIWLIAHTPKVSRLHEPNLGSELRRWVSDDRNAWPASPWTSPAAAVCRVDDGIPDRVDRTGALGNSIVPQIAEIIGQAILTAERQQARAA